MKVLESLFEPERGVDSAKDVMQIWHLLGRYDIQRLGYDGEIGCNPGYIFRGEAAWPCPLQSSLEREVRKDCKTHLSSSELIKKEKIITEDFLKSRRCEQLLIEFRINNGYGFIHSKSVHV
jgi:hypothetical protein